MMSFKVSTVLGIALVSVVLLLVTVHRYESQLQAAHETVRQYSAQLADLKTQNSRLSKQIGAAANWKLRSGRDLVELTRLRAEVERLRGQRETLGLPQTNQIAKVNAAQAAQLQAVSNVVALLGTNALAKDAWKFAGYQTPVDALESVAWAMKNGDVNAYLSSLTPDAQEAMEKAFDGMSDAEVAEMLENQIDGLDTLPLDQVTNVSDDEMSFVLYSEDTTDGVTNTHDEAVATFVNINGQWRFTGMY